jgi:hypothetical protein
MQRRGTAFECEHRWRSIYLHGKPARKARCYSIASRVLHRLTGPDQLVFSMFQIVAFIVECFVVVIGLIEIETKFHPIRKLLNWNASRSRLAIRKRIDELTSTLTTLQSKLDRARKYTVEEILTLAFRLAFLVLVCISMALLMGSPLIDVLFKPSSLLQSNLTEHIHNLALQRVLRVIAYGFRKQCQRSINSVANSTRKKEGHPQW